MKANAQCHDSDVSRAVDLQRYADTRRSVRFGSALTVQTHISPVACNLVLNYELNIIFHDVMSVECV